MIVCYSTKYPVAPVCATGNNVCERGHHVDTLSFHRDECRELCLFPPSPLVMCAKLYILLENDMGRRDEWPNTTAYTQQDPRIRNATQRELTLGENRIAQLLCAVAVPFDGYSTSSKAVA